MLERDLVLEKGRRVQGHEEVGEDEAVETADNGAGEAKRVWGYKEAAREDEAAET